MSNRLVRRQRIGGHLMQRSGGIISIFHGFSRDFRTPGTMSSTGEPRQIWPYHVIKLIEKYCKSMIVVPRNQVFRLNGDSEYGTCRRKFQILDDFRRFAMDSVSYYTNHMWRNRPYQAIQTGSMDWTYKRCIYYWKILFSKALFTNIYIQFLLSKINSLRAPPARLSGYSSALTLKSNYVFWLTGGIHKQLTYMIKPYVWTTLYQISSFLFHLTCIPSFSLFLLLICYIPFFS